MLDPAIERQPPNPRGRTAFVAAGGFELADDAHRLMTMDLPPCLPVGREEGLPPDRHLRPGVRGAEGRPAAEGLP